MRARNEYESIQLLDYHAAQQHDTKESRRDEESAGFSKMLRLAKSNNESLQRNDKIIRGRTRVDLDAVSTMHRKRKECWRFDRNCVPNRRLISRFKLRSGTDNGNCLMH
jgi:hypothetical protein